MKKIGKYIFPIFFVLLIGPTICKGQKNTEGSGLHEIGAGLGGLNYTGELSAKYNFKNYRPAGLIFYRFNPSPVVSFRFSLMGGIIGANESKSSDPVSHVRQGKFSSQLLEFATAFEYNFFNYRSNYEAKKGAYRFSPYFTAGLCLFNSKTGGGLAVGVPIGLGLKYQLNRRLNLGIEFVARKTFTDDLDGVSSSFIGAHQTANLFDKDWYYLTAITISRTSYSVECAKHYR